MNTEQNNNPLLIVPYTTYDGIPTFTDSNLAQLYHQTKEDGFLEQVFYNQDPSVFLADSFVRMFKDPNILLYLIFWNKEPAGYMWLTDYADRRAQGNFCFFKKHHKQKYLVPMGSDCLQYLLNIKDQYRRPLLDVIYGLTPTTNPAAVGWIQKIGMTAIGTIPKACFNFKLGHSVDAVVTYCERKE